FQIRYDATAAGSRGASTVRIWSQPTPKWRSAMRAQVAGSGGALPSRRSSTTKSLPAPCILVNRIATSGPGGGPAVGFGFGHRLGGPGAVAGFLAGGRLARRRLVLHGIRLHQRPLVAAGGQQAGQEGGNDESLGHAGSVPAPPLTVAARGGATAMPR